MTKPLTDPLPLRMDAYYYSFEPTGIREIDLILSAVACAGKAFHHTEMWGEEDTYPPHTGTTPRDWIQNAANAAAESVRRARSSEGRDAALRAEIAEWRRIASAIPEDSHDERTAIFRCASRVEVLLRTEAEDWPESAHRTARVFLDRDATTYDAHGCPACDHPVERTLTCANCDEEIPVIVEPPPDASPSPADRERDPRDPGSHDPEEILP